MEKLNIRFSERIGKRKPKDKIQIDSMDQELKNCIWSLIHKHLLKPLLYSTTYKLSAFNYLIEEIWFTFFKEPIDQIPLLPNTINTILKNNYSRWNYLDIYDFIDFLTLTESPINKVLFIEDFNNLLKRELSGYRFINGQLAPITNEYEINEIENALSVSDNLGLDGVNIHLSDALNKLSDRRDPDFRNSIKESISAIESLCKIITNEPKAELSKALKKLGDRITIHPALSKGFENIYGYTSDGDGIRHSLMTETDLDQEDALYMLISCSAFINYLIAKASKAGINFTTNNSNLLNQ